MSEDTAPSQDPHHHHRAHSQRFWTSPVSVSLEHSPRSLSRRQTKRPPR